MTGTQGIGFWWNTFITLKPYNWIRIIITLVEKSNGFIAQDHAGKQKQTNKQKNWLIWDQLPDGLNGKESACNAGDPGLIPGWGRSPEEGNGNPTHSSILAWKIPWTEEHGRLQSVGLQRVRHNWVTITFTLQTDKNGYNLLMAFLWDISVSCSIFSI